ncbi:MAG: hypothetical protein IIY21_02965 [Clostridiales bacterium]|nr:hypothetical protein [Clostridiales bacterium]
MKDLIERQAVIDALEKVADLFPWRVPGKRDTYDSYNEAWNDAIGRAEMEIEKLPSVQPVDKDINVSCKDAISRQAAIDFIDAGHLCNPNEPRWSDNEVVNFLKSRPSVQPEPLSDAYMKAVWTWLLDYQIKAAELKGRYTPYEVLSWVANDWRKEHE